MSMISKVMPNFLLFPPDTLKFYVNAMLLIVLSGLVAFFISRFAAHQWKGNKNKTAIGFVSITVAFTVLLLAFFGCSAITVRGIIFCLILLFSSYSDIKTRECSDWLHVMIVIAAFIGCDIARLPMMFAAAMFVGGLMLMTLLLTNSPLGGADIKCAIACSFLLGFEKGIIALIGSLLIAIVLNAFKDKTKGFTLIPYLTAGYLAVYLI